MRSRRVPAITVATATLLVGVGCSSKAHVPEEHAVAIRAMQFDPAVVRARVGDMIVWTNEDIVPHTATAAGTFDSQQISSKQQWRYTVTHAGDIAYSCTFHPTMHGTIRAK
jgi:plastocyanin